MKSIGMRKGSIPFHFLDTTVGSFTGQWTSVAGLRKTKIRNEKNENCRLRGEIFILTNHAATMVAEHYVAGASVYGCH
jgi:hypothetical protein